MKEFQNEFDRLMRETYNRYNMTIAYVVNCLKEFGDKGVPVVWDDENYVADAVYDDCECVRYEINAIRVADSVLPQPILEVHIVNNNHEVCDEWIEINDFDIETAFGIIGCIKFEQSK